MPCVCGSTRNLFVSGKTSDMCFVSYAGHESEGYVPSGLHIGGGDYLEFGVCLDCGRVKGDFPLSEERVFAALHITPETL